MLERTYLSRFTPSRTNPNVLEAIFVQRQDLAHDTIDRIRDSAMTGDKHHLLLVGPRGSGKTHFVSIVFHRVKALEDLRDRLRIAWLKEDETTTTFLDLLIRVFKALAALYPDEFRSAELNGFYDLAAEAAAKRIAKLLLERLAGRALLIIVENLDALFEGLKDKGQKQWRAFLQENAACAMLATSQKLFSAVSLRQSPFFGHFQVEHLKPLTPEEATELLAKIADLNGDTRLAAFVRTTSGKDRIRALHHLTGGNYRIYIVLSEFIDAESLDQLIGPFEKVLDELTPYYQSRIAWLSPQQRKLVEFLCTCERPVPVKELARRLFITHQTTASQLKELRLLGYVESHARGREMLYELSEPLMRLCVEVKENAQKPMRLIVDFLRLWYDRAQLETRLQSLPAEAQFERQYVEEALRQMQSEPVTHAFEEVFSEILEVLRSVTLEELEAGTPEAIEAFRGLVRTSDRAEFWTAFAQYLLEFGKFDEVVPVVEQALRRAPGDALAWGILGSALNELGRHEEALFSYDEAVRLTPDRARVWINRGVALEDLGRREEALVSYDEALRLKPDEASVWYNRGVVLHYLGRPEAALISYDKVVRLNPDDVWAWNNRGVVLDALGRLEEALASYDEAVRLKPDEARAWNNRGDVLNRLGRREEALACYEKTVELKPNHAKAWSNRGVMLSTLGRDEEALASYDEAVRLKPDDAPDWSNRGVVLHALGRHEEAIASYEEAIRVEPDEAKAWFNRGNALRTLGRRAEALASYDETVRLKPDHAKAWNNRGVVLHDLGRRGDALASYDEALRLKPDEANAWTNRGVVLNALGRHKDALAALDEACRLQPDNLIPWYNRAESLIVLRPRDAALDYLQQCLLRFPPRNTGWAGDTSALLYLLFASSVEEEKWNPLVDRLVQIFAEAQALTFLGEGLVRSLGSIAAGPRSEDAFTSWRGAWHAAGDAHEELRIPLRILDAGIRYLQTKDPRVLFDLLVEERKVLAEVLKIDPEAAPPAA